MNVKINVIPVTQIAVSIKRYVDYFEQWGSSFACAQIEDPLPSRKIMQYLIRHQEEIEWGILGIESPERFISIVKTLISDLECISHQNTIRPHVIIKESREPKKLTKTSGYVYLIRSIGYQAFYKIGLSKNPDARMSAFGVLLPFPIERIHIIKTDDMRGVEKSLHTKYADKRVNGEWFALSQDDVQEICAMKGIE